MHFADELIRRTSETSPIVVGIDPDFGLMPQSFWPASSSRKSVREALLRFVRSVLDSTFDVIPAVKYQSAFFEKLGVAGIEALAESIQYARSKDLLVILDAKRGDIGSTSLSYAIAYLSGKSRLQNGLVIPSGLDVDCMTINPFLGEDSVLPFVETARREHKGIFVLVKTSNPGSAMLMDRQIEGRSISELLAARVDEWGRSTIGRSGYSCVGAVVGATYPVEARQLRRLMPRAILLAPGVGAQGGTVETARACFNQAEEGTIVPISRAATYPSSEEVKEHGFESAVRRRVLGFIARLRGTDE